MPDHHHRSGPLKQSNKRNKRSLASKRSITRQAGGKVEGRRVGFKQRLVAHNKADRRHIQQQRRDVKRAELVRRKRGIDGESLPPPRVIGIISLGSNEEIEAELRDLILQQADRVFKSPSSESDDIDDTYPTVTAKFEKHKKDGNLTVLTNSTAFKSHYKGESNDDAALFAALDLCRVCDLVLFVIDGNGERDEDVVGMNIGGEDRSFATGKTGSTAQDWEHLISERGDRILSTIKTQGIPRVATILAKTGADPDLGGDFEDDDDQMTTQSGRSIRRGNLKRKTDIKKYVSRFATTEFGVNNDKVIEVILGGSDGSGGPSDDAVDERSVVVDPVVHKTRILADSLVRTLCTMAASPSNWVSQVPRSYILADSHSYDEGSEELTITGYVRGLAPYDVNSLMHVPNVGTFSCRCLRKAKNPSARANPKDVTLQDDADVIESDPMKRDSLERFAAPDALDGEQNLVGFDEEDEDVDGDDSHDNTAADMGGKIFARPTGWSDYQSAWLDGVDDDAIDTNDFDHGELAEELNKKSSQSVATNAMDLDEANEISKEERQALVEQRRKQQQEDQEFPDEVQVDEEEKARDRFARYRSLKSFKKSHWDSKENLPDSYASIFHFANFKSTQRAVMAEMKDMVKEAEACNGNFWNGHKKSNGGQQDETTMGEGSDEEDDSILMGCVPSGSYISITLECVKSDDLNGLGDNPLLCAVSLLPHENKVSVLHMGLSNCKDSTSDVPVKSKDLLTFRCGWRTWTGRPVFSQNNLNCDKHKFERFLPPQGNFFAASVFGPVTYTPCPVLAFREVNGRKVLAAFGSMMGADADRIIVKRIILTGYPVRVHKRFATVKYMFYDPEDVKWFKPAELTTKHGLNGKIEQSVGEHGTMKCLFNAPIKQHDTVCLCLYKRIYPKFADSETQTFADGVTVRSIKPKQSLIVK
jgi:pre-rRNA-processing protein TSR1